MWNTGLRVVSPPDRSECVPVFVPHGLDSTIWQVVANLVGSSSGILLYVGPDQIMPLASVLSAIVGVAVMFWHRLVAFARMCFGFFRRRGRPPQGEPTIEDRA
jgi:hypothetical protein